MSSTRRPHRCAVCEERNVPCLRGTEEGCYVCENGPDICTDCHTSLVEASCIGCRHPPMYCQCEEEELVYYDHPLEACPLYEGYPLQIGDRVCHHVAAPGTGRIVYEVIQLDPKPLGIVVENTVRDLELWEVI